MRRRLTSLLLILCLLAAPAAYAASAGDTVSARTPISGESEAQRLNIQTAASAINGTRVAYGESFSFNDIVGPRTTARGYLSARNGRGVEVTGGGVAQVATTLYLALLDIPGSVRFDEVSTYGRRFTERYVSDGSLAVITDYSAGTDFRFTNFAADMLIQLWLNESYLYCSVTLGGDAASQGGWFDGWSGPAAAPSAPGGQRVASARVPLSSDAGARANAERAAGSVNDTTLASGDTFSFNRVVGPRSEAFGYVDGVNGRGAVVTGGGVAQVASALWLAIRDVGDFAILEKSTYGKKYNQDYVESAADAILTDYAAGIDFSFRYTGPGSVTLYTYIQDGALVCDIVRG